MEFAYPSYIKFLKELKSKGKLSTFSEWDGTPTFLLRFDVDFDLNAAVKIAEINKGEDIKSTFFIMTSCHFYNPLSWRNRELINKISSQNTEIGLHFDPTVYKTNSKSILEKRVHEECRILHSITHNKVRSISLHNPSIHKTYPLFKGFVNAYDPLYFNEQGYISDSRKNFKGKELSEFINGINQTSIQIALHPMHYSEREISYKDIMIKHVVSYIKAIDKNFSVNETYVKETHSELLDHFIR